MEFDLLSGGFDVETLIAYFTYYELLALEKRALELEALKNELVASSYKFNLTHSRTEHQKHLTALNYNILQIQDAIEVYEASTFTHTRFGVICWN
jgi:hypothetical protein